MNEDRRKLNLLTPLIALGVITLVIVVLMTVLTNVDKKRKQDVHDQYTAETQNWMKKNKKTLSNIFTEAIPNSCETQPNYYNCANGEDVTKKLSSDIKDFSSIMFMKHTSKGEIITMRLSGQTNLINYNDDKINDLHQLLLGGKGSLPWDDYFYELQGKEVVVPVKDDKGKIIGAIIRGVIEK